MPAAGHEPAVFRPGPDAAADERFVAELVATLLQGLQPAD
jgi:hypothetical protein